MWNDSPPEFPDDPDTGEYGIEIEAPPQWAVLILEELHGTIAEAVEDAITAAANIATGTSNSTTTAQPRPALYSNVVEWVTHWLAPTIIRLEKLSVKWCPSWWDHPEVLVRMQGLWETWEQARQSPAHMLAWFRDEFDYHFAHITAPGGPMAHCTWQTHKGSGKPLPVNQPSSDHFTGKETTDV